ncbi:AAA domain-containing protein [Fodinicola acaciae]|uniref:AAA domain-containing protein n=1 Tax=Fodinicola acaciae TaxID=2681555 RepID=UPI001FEC4A38|nr:AAA domain-containing protein [Fodinicola acaciae]
MFADAGSFQPPGADRLRPENEFLVHDADSSQHHAIYAALADQHVLIEGPPGTGKSQTIANIIAGAAATGKRVLFVAEKRAAIEAVTDRLAAVELSGLVFDLHQSRLSKRDVAKRLLTGLERVTSEPPVDASDCHRRLADRRAQLNNHVKELHEKRPPWNVSAFEVRERILALGPTAATSKKIREPHLEAVDANVIGQLEDDLRKFVEIGGPRVLREDTPWWRAELPDTDAIRSVLLELDELAGRSLQDSNDQVRYVAGQAGLPEPTTIEGWDHLLALLDGVANSVRTFSEAIFSLDVNGMHAATASRGERAKLGQRLPWLQRRALVKLARSNCLLGIRSKAALHAELTKIVHQQREWHRIGGANSSPRTVAGLAAVMSTYQTARRQLAAVAMCARIPDLQKQTQPVVRSTLEKLQGDRDMLFQLPEISRLRRTFSRFGLDDLLADIARKNCSSEQAARQLRYAWLRSLDEEFRLGSATLRDFAGERQDRLVDEFGRVDEEHLAANARRVRRAVAVRTRKANDQFPVEARLLKTEASKKARHLPMRELVGKASNVLLALHPC